VDKSNKRHIEMNNAGLLQCVIFGSDLLRLNDNG